MVQRLNKILYEIGYTFGLYVKVYNPKTKQFEGYMRKKEFQNMQRVADKNG